MSPQERTLLTRFLQDLDRSRGGLKDAEAAGLIDRGVRDNPDAAYLLVQHAILSDQALHAAQAHISELEGRLAEANPQSQFLGGQGARSGPWGAAPPQYPPQDASRYPGAQAPPVQGRGLFGGGSGQSGGFGSFLRSAGTTAAGVAGGAFLMEGLSGLFGGHRGFGGGFGGGWGGPPVENVTINEYGDDQPDNGGDNAGYDDGGGDLGGGYDDGGVS